MVDVTRTPARAAFVGALVFAVLAGWAARAQWQLWLDLNDPRPLLCGLPAGGARQLAAPPPRQVRRVVLLIADGLLAGLVGELPELRALSAQGIVARAQAAPPTLSSASYVTWLAGLDPVDSGVRTNRYRPPLPLDSLLARARGAGLRTMAFQDGAQLPLVPLFRPSIGRDLAPDTPWPEVIDALAEVDLAVIALDGVDHAGHRYGPEHPAYRRAALELDQRVGQLRRTLDLASDLLVVVNDHGHLPGSGGHGGLEAQVRELFVVAAGRGITRGRRGEAGQRDLAPTLAGMLGLAPPAHGRGWPMWWALDQRLAPGFHAALFTVHLQTRFRVEQYLARKLGVSSATGRGLVGVAALARAGIGDLGRARDLARRSIDQIARRIQGAQQTRLGRLRGQRIWRGLLVLALIIGVALALRRWKLVSYDKVGLFVLPVVFVLAAYGGMRLLGIRPTMSFNASLQVWFLKAALSAAAAAWLVLGLGLATAGEGGPADAAIGRVVAAWVVLAGVAVCFTAMTPVQAGAALPDMRLLAATLLLRLWLVFFTGWAALALALLAGKRALRRGAQTPPIPG